MERRTLITGVALPLGLAGLFWLVDVSLLAVLFVFTPVWVGQGTEWVSERLRPRSARAWRMGGYHACSVGLVAGLWGARERLDVAALSFLIGVCVFKLWVLFSLPLWSSRPWAYRVVGSGVGYLVTVFGALAASIGVHVALLGDSSVHALPLVAGVYLEFLLMLTSVSLDG